MSPASENSTVAITKFFKAEQAWVEGCGWVSVDPEGTARMKVLPMDEANLSYDMLLWVAPGNTFGSGRHTHGGVEMDCTNMAHHREERESDRNCP